MNYPGLLKKVKDYVRQYYKKHPDDRLAYHNFDHTKAVVAAAAQIGDHYQLNDHDFFAIKTAAWFQDLGYLINRERHEEESAQLVASFLKKHKIDTQTIDLVKGCILATKIPQTPNNKLEKIVCDADQFHLGTEEFIKEYKLMNKEQLNFLGIAIDKKDRCEKYIDLLEEHQYHTDYCQALLNSEKQVNIQKLKDKIDTCTVKPMEENADAMTDLQKVSDTEHEESKKNKNERPDKGIETMFRISSSNHQRLSDMADNKAHIMITVNSIILSAIISLMLRKLTEYEYLMIPTFILLSVSLLAMTLSILSTRPSIPHGVFKHSDVEEKNVNLLFFGNFYKMPLEEYMYGMLKMMDDKTFLYGSLIRDVYHQGVVLGKKYRLLRHAYSVFMFGLILAVVAFIMASAFHHPNANINSSPNNIH